MTKKDLAARWPALRRYTNSFTPLVKHFGRRTLQFIIHSSIPSCLFIASIIIARYLPNSDFSYPSEIILPIVLFSIVATLFFYLYRWTFRGNNLPAQIATLLLTYALYGFNYAFSTVKRVADSLLPSSLTTSFSSAATRIVLLGVIFWTIAYAIAWAVRRIKPLHSLQPLKIVVFAVCFIFLWQAVHMGARLWSIRNQLSYNYVAELPAKPTHLPDKKPNIYYFVFDRYASTETLRDVYKFDNTPLLTTFAEQGFVTRQQAYANYPFTQQSISSTFAMDYLTDLSKRFKDDAGKFQTAFPYRSILSNPPIAQVLKQNGYQFNQISSWWDFTRVGSIAADHDPVKSFRLRVLGLDFWLTDLQRDIVHKSAFSPLLQKGITIGGTAIIKYDQDRNPRQNFQDQMEALEKLVHATGKNSAAEAAAKIPSPQQSPRTQNQGQPAKPQFTFAHILVPHDPYIFAADGSPAPYNGDRTDQDVDEFTKYTGQLTYVNTRIEELIKTIRTEDPDAIIAFQPDEGPYPKEFRGKLTSDHYFDPKNLNDTSMRHKFGITASYYMPGIDPATVTGELNSSVNLFPFILNHYLGYDLPYRPECNFSAGNKFVLYEYQQLTGRLHNLPDNANPDECAQHVP